MLRGEAFELSAEVVAGFVDVLEQIANLIQKFNRDCGCQRTSAECGSVQAGVHAAGYTIGGENRA